MAMESNPSMQPMYDPRRVNNPIITQQPKPDSTVPSPPQGEQKVLEAANESTLADLASSEISLDLQVNNLKFFTIFKVMTHPNFSQDEIP